MSGKGRSYNASYYTQKQQRGRGRPTGPKSCPAMDPQPGPSSRNVADFFEDLQDLDPIHDDLVLAMKLDEEAKVLEAAFFQDEDTFFKNATSRRTRSHNMDVEHEMDQIKEKGRQALALTEEKVELTQNAEDAIRRTLRRLDKVLSANKKGLEAVNPGITNALEQKVKALDITSEPQEESDEQLEDSQVWSFVQDLTSGQVENSKPKRGRPPHKKAAPAPAAVPVVKLERFDEPSGPPARPVLLTREIRQQKWAPIAKAASQAVAATQLVQQQQKRGGGASNLLATAVLGPSSGLRQQRTASFTPGNPVSQADVEAVKATYAHFGAGEERIAAKARARNMLTAMRAGYPCGLMEGNGNAAEAAEMAPSKQQVTVAAAKSGERSRRGAAGPAPTAQIGVGTINVGFPAQIIKIKAEPLDPDSLPQNQVQVQVAVEASSSRKFVYDLRKTKSAYRKPEFPARSIKQEPTEWVPSPEGDIDNFLQADFGLAASGTGSRRPSSSSGAPPPEIYLAGDPTPYCLCKLPSYGGMVACDGEKCPIEWFHFGCVGLASIPAGKWYCEACKEKGTAAPPAAAAGSTQTKKKKNRRRR